MVISSRTPEGWPDKCPMCGHVLCIEPSARTFDALCPQCGHLLWCANLVDVASTLNASRLFAEAATVDYPDDLTIPANVMGLIPESIAREYSALPLADREDALIVAVANSCNIETIEKIRFMLNRKLRVIRVTEEWVEKQICKHYGDIPPNASFTNG